MANIINGYEGPSMIWRQQVDRGHPITSFTVIEYYVKTTTDRRDPTEY